MSDKLEFVAAAQINADAGGISFRSNAGFKTASRASAGVYDLQLDDKQDGHKLVIHVTPNNAIESSIQATVVTGDTRSIDITNFADGPADTAFYISVWRIHS
jgi:hypothetical protein